MIIFMHFPKTAGTTLDQIIKHNYDADQFKHIKTEGDRLLWINMPENEKRKIHVITGHIAYGLHEFVPWACSYVTMLRHPFDRILSWYYYIQDKGTHALSKLCSEKSLSDLIAGQYVSETNNGMTRYLAGRYDIGIRPPFDLTHDDDLTLAKIRLNNFRFVGFQETFDDCLKNLAVIFNWNNLDYVSMLVNKDRRKIESLTDAEIEILTKYNKQDLALYEYAKEIA